LIGLTGLGLIGGGLYLVRTTPDGLTSTPMIIGFEKGSRAGTATALG